MDTVLISRYTIEYKIAHRMKLIGWEDLGYARIPHWLHLLYCAHYNTNSKRRDYLYRCIRICKSSRACRNSIEMLYEITRKPPMFKDVLIMFGVTK